MMKRSLAFLPFLAGCYSYTAVQPTSVPVGTEVRVRITGAASDRVAPMIGSLDTRELIGKVVENNAGSMILQVPMGAMPNVTSGVVPMQTRVPISPIDLVRLEQRKLDVGRTSLMATTIAVGVGVAAAAALKYGGHGEPGRGTEDPPPINRIPIRLWRVQF